MGRLNRFGQSAEVSSSLLFEKEVKMEREVHVINVLNLGFHWRFSVHRKIIYQDMLHDLSPH